MSTRVSDFSIEVPAKWVLTGEHSVLRGKSALAFAYPELNLKLNFREQAELSITPNPFQSQVMKLIGRSLSFLGLREEAFRGGDIHIQSEIPIGAGLGSSAAVSVAMARLVLWKTKSDLHHWIPLATHLEDVFHGKSSGMDVSAIANHHPILFSMSGKATALTELTALPTFKLYDTGERGHTRQCIEQVEAFRAKNLELAIQTDEQMQWSTDHALKGLRIFQSDPAQGLEVLARAMNQAQSCFETWGLVPPALMIQKKDLLAQGAMAVKLTGAGQGGFWVALWNSGKSTA